MAEKMTKDEFIKLVRFYKNDDGYFRAKMSDDADRPTGKTSLGDAQDYLYNQYAEKLVRGIDITEPL